MKLGPPSMGFKMEGRRGRLTSDGIYEVWRAKAGNIFLKHYGIFVVINGEVLAFDLQVGEGPRDGISFEKVAEGKKVQWTLRFLPGPGRDAAVDRLKYAVEHFRDWLAFKDNCEHSARFVSRNERVSGQSNGIGVVAACPVVGAIFAVAN